MCSLWATKIMFLRISTLDLNKTKNKKHNGSAIFFVYNYNRKRRGKETAFSGLKIEQFICHSYINKLHRNEKG